MNVRERESFLSRIACQNNHPQGLSSFWRICDISLKQMEIKMEEKKTYRMPEEAESAGGMEG